MSKKSTARRSKKSTARRVEPETVGVRDLAPYLDERGVVAAYNKMSAAIEAMDSVDEVKPIRDKMVASQFYARIAKDKKAEFTVSALRIEAERKTGQIIAEMQERGELAGPGDTNQKRISSANDIRRLNL